MKRLLSKLTAKQLQQRSTKHIFMRTGEALGFVYFGNVSQHDDEHTLIRGHTLSSSHRDKHYMVGSLYGYDMAFVERNDTIVHPNKPKSSHSWTILQIDLHSSAEIPHIYIGLKEHNETFRARFATTFPTLHDMTDEIYPTSPVHSDRYGVYVRPADVVDTRKLIDEQTWAQIVHHFGHLTIELVDSQLYIYSEHRRITKALLETMIKNGVWLARHIDERLTLLHHPQSQ
jgi:hypothetical protein